MSNEYPLVTEYGPMDNWPLRFRLMIHDDSLSEDCKCSIANPKTTRGNIECPNVKTVLVNISLLLH